MLPFVMAIHEEVWNFNGHRESKKKIIIVIIIIIIIISIIIIIIPSLHFLS